jgi:transposase
MQKYHSFIGIDIGKFNFVINLSGTKNTQMYENNPDGIAQFIKDHKNILPNTLCVLETTGGHELGLLYTLCQYSFPVHRADTRKVKNFIKSFGSVAKTDNLDARALSEYGKERADKLELFSPPSRQAITLFQLVQRRADLTKMLVAEKNRLKSPTFGAVKNSYKTLIKVLSDEIEIITAQIKELINSDVILKEKLKILKTIPGIGDIIAFNLLTCAQSK